LSCRFITFDDLADVLGNTTEYEALEKIWEESLLEVNSRLDRITLHDFKRIMKGRPKEGMTAFIQSSPGLVPALADPAKLPDFNLSTVAEEDNNLPAESILSNMEQHKHQQMDVESEVLASMSSSSVFMDNENNSLTTQTEYGGSLWSSLTVGEITSNLRRSSLPITSSSPATIGTNGIVSPLAANRAIYRQSLLRRSVVADLKDEMPADVESDEMRSSTRASLVMKRGTLFPPISTDGDGQSEDKN
jgi:hypothetical protein